MRAEISSTKRAKGINVPHKRGHVAVTIIIPNADFAKLKAKAISNCRSLSAECRFHILQAMRAENDQ